VADANNFLHLLRGIREQDRAREHAEIGQAVALIGVQLFARSDQAARANDFTQLVEILRSTNARGRILRFRCARFGIALVHSCGAATGAFPGLLGCSLKRACPHQCMKVKPCGTQYGKT